MGCASSKKSPVCHHCHNRYSSPATRRSYSMHVHHPPQSRGDSYHVVELTSSTLGSLSSSKIEYEIKTIVNDSEIDRSFRRSVGGNENANKEFSMGLIEAKTWSDMINEKIPKVMPKTPTRTPPGEPETINTWELMEGLEDISPLRNAGDHLRSFSFDVVRSSPCPVSVTCCVDLPKSRFHGNSDDSANKPMWLPLLADHENRLESSEVKIPDFDPDVISGFRKSFENFKADDPFHFQDGEELNEDGYNDVEEDEMQEEEDDSPYHFSDLKSCVISDYKCGAAPNGDAKGAEKIVLYFTSLRGVRKTYEDCCHVRLILKGVGVRVDERDVSMHSGFKDELKELVKDASNRVITLPQVFLGEKHIGGAEEIRRMHEDGKLEKLLESCKKLNGAGGGGGPGPGVCDACGDIRFMPCETCSGSCKIYYEDENDLEVEEEEEEEAMEGESGFQRCPDCNENGLIRCPICCY